MRQTILRTQAGNWVIFLMVFVFIFALAGKIPAQEPPGWLAAGTGTYFEVTGSEYLNVFDVSDDPFSAAVNPSISMIYIGLRAPGALIAVQDTIYPENAP